ncbi:MAG: hypothetical protein IJA14_01030 [Alphaproteobacteria bacterium]|nr:hypothetical protein [Alphaproteobacteria bacterium]
MNVKILKSDKKLYDGEAAKLTLPTVRGQITILPNHISIMTNLSKGTIYVKDAAATIFSCEAEDGVCSFFANEAVVILKSDERID